MHSFVVKETVRPDLTAQDVLSLLMPTPEYPKLLTDIVRQSAGCSIRIAYLKIIRPASQDAIHYENYFAQRCSQRHSLDYLFNPLPNSFHAFRLRIPHPHQPLVLGREALTVGESEEVEAFPYVSEFRLLLVQRQFQISQNLLGFAQGLSCLVMTIAQSIAKSMP